MRIKGPYLLFTVIVSAFVLCSHVSAERQAEAVMIRAVELYQKGDMKNAHTLLKQAATLDPENDAIYYYLGYVAVEANDADAALENFGKAYELDSANVWYAMRLASICAMVGKTDKAERIYASLREKRRGDPNVLSALSDIYIRQNKFAQADSILARMEMQEGVSEYTIMSRIEMSRQKGDFAEFFSRLNNLFAMEEMPGPAKRDMLEKLIKGGDPRFNYLHIKDYEKLMETCLRTHPKDTAVLHYAGSFYYSLDRYQILDSLSMENPEDSFLSVILMYMQFRDGRYEDALLSGDRVLELSAGDAKMQIEALTTRADCHFALGRHDEAFREYDRILRMSPDNTLILNNYAYYLSLDGRSLGRAARMSQKAVEAEPENAVYLDTYAWILFKKKKYDASKAYFKKAMLYGGKQYPEILRHYAALLEAMGQKDLAEGYMHQAEMKENEKKK